MLERREILTIRKVHLWGDLVLVFGLELHGVGGLSVLSLYTVCCSSWDLLLVHRKQTIQVRKGEDLTITICRMCKGLMSSYMVYDISTL